MIGGLEYYFFSLSLHNTLKNPASIESNEATPSSPHLSRGAFLLFSSCDWPQFAVGNPLPFPA